MKLTPQQLQEMGYDAREPGSVLYKAHSFPPSRPGAVQNGQIPRPRADSTHFDDPKAMKSHPPAKCVKTRIRQSSKPLMNKLEQEWFLMLKATGWMANLRAQAKRFRLGNGIWFKVDITCHDSRDGRETAYEVKGPHAFRGGFENLKVAAGLFPEIRWILVWKEAGDWKQQEILP